MNRIYEQCEDLHGMALFSCKYIDIETLVTGVLIALFTIIISASVGFIIVQIQKAWLRLSTNPTNNQQPPQQSPPQPPPQPQDNTPEENKEQVMPPHEIRVSSFQLCPRSGPYQMMERPAEIRTFEKGQQIPPVYFGLSLHRVTWSYIHPSTIAVPTGSIVPRTGLYYTLDNPQYFLSLQQGQPAPPSRTDPPQQTIWYHNEIDP